MDLLEFLKSFGTVAGSLGIIELIKFFVSRKDQKQIRQEDREDKKNDEVEKLRKETKAQLDNLHDEFERGLAERETRSTGRYLEHKEAILQMSSEHKKDFQELLRAIQQLTNNDTNISQLVENNQQTVGIVANGIVGIIHNTILYTSKGILERGVVTFEELATLESLYVPYARLGGNGDVKKRYEKVNELKTVTKEEADRIDEQLKREKYKELQKDVES